MSSRRSDMRGVRQILFLQGLPGRFFFDLGEAMAARGCGVHRVNFNGGDQWDWPAPGALNYRGSAQAWPARLARLIRERSITDIVLFGDCRPLHRTARAAAAGLGVAVHVFEEGYLRPDWITLERGGVNGFSALPSDPAWWLRAADAAPPIEDAPPLPSSLPRRVRDTLAYYVFVLLLGAAFPHYRTHRPWPPLVEAFGWLAHLCRRGGAARCSTQALASLRPEGFFLTPLQLDSDYQLRAHSDFNGMQPALAEIVASFAAHAPADTQLVVKAHPLDNGLIDWRRRVGDYARALGVGERVRYVETADIDPLVRAARGVATVNSTTGTLALAAGVPVITLGRAIYDLPGLTHQGSLAGFWRAPTPPQASLYEAFRRVLAERSLLRGGFYAEDREGRLVAAAAGRIAASAPFVQPARRLRTAPTADAPVLAAAE
ncbi:MAG: capsular biosynthesis protein [Caulobacteraceae bacterium]|nr:capsular biosynthesis protein [Caulobacteraceae bacterium]